LQFRYLELNCNKFMVSNFVKDLYIYTLFITFHWYAFLISKPFRCHSQSHTGE
jgi:hypothetical protein